MDGVASERLVLVTLCPDWSNILNDETSSVKALIYRKTLVYFGTKPALACWGSFDPPHSWGLCCQ